ncbi:uncharacterized protein LOC125943396 [Dermacentor silvarum]|uniref:uncharacterized protein LOC125943396 n=1 Tax=Dermacentor silvarum TaxID=543639 RepID=UPI002101A356|nr:uncharacterized protein LOC125943396 [Dermacentor silvarum]
MPRVCSVEGCINGPRRLVRGSGSVDPTVSFHVVPRDEPRRSQWLSALPMIKRQKDEPEKQMSLGVPQRPVLSRAAVPSVSPSSNPLLVPLQQQAGGSVAIAESAIESDAAGAPVEIPTESDVAETERLQHDAATGPVGRHGEVLAAATGAAGLQTQKDSFQCPACGTTGRSVGHDKSVQVHVRGISVGVQVNLTIKETKDEGLQVDIQDVPLTSTPVKRRRILDEPSFAASPILSPVPSNVDTTGSLYQPDELTHTLDSTLDEDDEDDGDMGDVELPGYYLIFHTCLMVLLKLCRTCLSTACTVKLRRSGTRIIAKVECPNMHTYTWSSQPLVGDKPKGNIDLATALLFSGSSVASSLRMMRLMGVKVISEQCFFNYQKAYLLPAVNMVWDEHQREVMASLEGSIQLCGDGRCDSPGHSAKFMTYTFLCPDAKKIVHTEQVQVRESDEITSSTQMEKEGLIRGLAFLSEQNVSITSLTTDRHPSIKDI